MKNNSEIKKYPEPNIIYKHYKGGTYKFLFMSKHSETDEDLVIYQSLLYGSFHARPLHMWFDKIKGHGERFKLLDK